MTNSAKTNEQLSKNEAMELIKDAMAFAYGEKAAFNSELLDAAWDCFCNAVQQNRTVDEAIRECVTCVNIKAF